MQSFASLQITATVDSNEVGLGDQITLSVTVRSSEQVSVSEPRVPNLNGFNLENSFQDQFESNQLTNVNGSMQYQRVSQLNFNYVLTPTKTGTLTIPAFEVLVNGKAFNTSPIKIQVGNAGSGNSRQRPRGRPQMQEPEEEDPFAQAEDMFNQLLRNRGVIPESENKKLKINPNEAFFILCDVDKKEVYEGEQIVANWYIYTRGNIMSLDRLKFPDLRGFWKEIIEEVPALNFTQEIINGIPYRKALLASHALFPIKPGTSVIDEYKIKAQVQIPTNPMSVFGFGKPYTFSKSSERINVTVKPLPLEGKPNNFSGAVGQFEVRSSLEGTEFPVNQPFSLKIRFEGSGNAKLIELPHLDLPPGIEIYDTKSDAKFFKDGRSFKEFEVLIIPRVEGKLKIPALEFSTFDPLQKKYVTKHTQEFEVNIIPNPNAAAVVNPKDSQTEAPIAKPKPKTDELPDILVSASKLDSLPRETQEKIWWLVFIAIFVSLIVRARFVLSFGVKSKDLQGLLNRRLKQVQSQINAGQWRQVGTSLTNAIYFVLGEISGQGGATLEMNKLVELIPPSVRRELGDALAKAIDKNQILSFAPETVVGKLKDKEEMQKNKDEIEKLLLKAIDLSSSELVDS